MLVISKETLSCIREEVKAKLLSIGVDVWVEEILKFDAFKLKNGANSNYSFTFIVLSIIMVQFWKSWEVFFVQAN